MKKILVSVVSLILTMSLFTGCGKKEVDYNLTNGTEAGTESNVSDGINDDSLEQFRNQDAWVEELDVTNQFEQEFRVEIDAEIVVPELTGMRVIQSKSLAEDEKFKMQCLKSFFGTDTEYYYHEREHYTKDEIIDWLEDYDDPGLNEAPDEHIVTEEFESVSHYAAYRDDVLYEITLFDDKISIEPNIREEKKLVPESLKDYKHAGQAIPLEEEEKNECKYSMEKAEQIADDYLLDIGLSSMECVSITPFVWDGHNDDLFDVDSTVVKRVCSGYTFEFITGSDRLSFDEFPEPWNYITSYQIGINETIDIQPMSQHDINYNPEEANSIGESSACITVTDNGVQSVIITNAATIEETSNSVGLLPLDTIKGIIREEVMERHAKYNLQQKYNQLALIYLRSTDAPEQSETDVHIPVWCLSYVSGEDDAHYQRTNYNPIFVNAIDGTIIHFADAEWAGREIPAVRNMY